MDSPAKKRAGNVPKKNEPMTIPPPNTFPLEKAKAYAGYKTPQGKNPLKEPNKKEVMNGFLLGWLFRL